VSPEQLLDAASTPGEITEEGLRSDVNVGFQYISFWLGGRGAAGINNLMEDAATAEISRSQIWQWSHASVSLEDGTVVDRTLVERVVAEEYAALVATGGAYAAHLETARDLFVATALDDEFVDFLTLPAYDEVLRAGG
jgi:malate synthase